MSKWENGQFTDLPLEVVAEIARIGETSMEWVTYGGERLLTAEDQPISPIESFAKLIQDLTSLPASSMELAIKLVKASMDAEGSRVVRTWVDDSRQLETIPGKDHDNEA